MISALKYHVMGMLVLLTFALPASASPQKAEKFIDDLGKKVVAVAQNSKLSTNAKQTKIKSIFAKNVDFTWIGNFVLGKHKRSAAADQKQRYQKAYKNFVIHSYAKRFNDYAGETFKIKSSRDAGKGKYLLTTEIVRAKEANVLVDYKVKKVGSNYKVYDIIVEGVSLITTQRSEFNSVISRKGLDFLIDQLEKKASA